MEWLWLYIVLGVFAVCATVSLVLRAISSYSPAEGFGDYEFSPDRQFDLDLFPSLVLPQGATRLKIMQLSDPQLKLGSIPHRDRKTLRLIRRAVQSEKPYLCVVTGDLTFSVFSGVAIRHFAKFMKKLNVKWAFVFGNHDAQCGCSKYTVSKILKKYDNCLFSVGPSNVDGKSNYLVNVYVGEKSEQNLKYSLVMLDSGAYLKHGGKIDKNRFGCIRQSQMEWYAWAVEGLRKIQPQIQSSMFFHIPLKEFADMYYLREQQQGREIPQSVRNRLPNVTVSDVTGTVCEPPKSKAAQAAGDEGYTVGIYYQQSEKGSADVFNRVQRLGCTKGVFCGHDHVNTLKGNYDGVYLAYGLCCGYHTYPFFKKFPSKSVVLNGALWVDESGRAMNRGVTVICIALSGNYGALDVCDKQWDEIFRLSTVG